MCTIMDAKQYCNETKSYTNSGNAYLKNTDRNAWIVKKFLGLFLWYIENVEYFPCKPWTKEWCKTSMFETVLSTKGKKRNFQEGVWTSGEIGPLRKR